MADTFNTSPASLPLQPINADQRVFGWHSHASLWFSLGVGLLVMQIGAYLVPAVGTQDALMAIVLGSLLGAGLLAWTARIGCDSGLGSAGLMHRVYGHSLARLPVLLNIIQLVGWTAFELVVMRDGTVAIAAQAWGVDATSGLTVVLCTALWGAVLVALMGGSMLGLVRGFVSRFGLPLVVLSLLWLSWQFAGKAAALGWETIWSRPGDGSMGALSALDLVLAMPVSWLPLVADFARHGRTGRSTLGGTWLGYALANAWCYGLGVLVATVSEPGADLVGVLLLAQGGLLALGLILLDELDNAYGDVYSGALASQSLLPSWSLRTWGMLGALLCSLLAMLLPMHSLEPFLLLLSSVFVPLYGVIIGRLGVAQRPTSVTATQATSHATSHPASTPATDTSSRAVDLSALASWLVGVALYHGLSSWAPQFGAALPTLLVCLVLGFASRPKAA